MLCGLLVVKQPTVLDGFAFDPFSFQQDGLAAPEVDVGWGEIVDALVITPVVVIGDERIDLGFEVAGQIVVLEQDAVFKRLMPALDFSLRHRMIRRTTSVPHVVPFEPFSQVARDIARPVVR
jgi:hypothetical protein